MLDTFSTFLRLSMVIAALLVWIHICHASFNIFPTKFRDVLAAVFTPIQFWIKEKTGYAVGHYTSNVFLSNVHESMLWAAHCRQDVVVITALSFVLPGYCYVYLSTNYSALHKLTLVTWFGLTFGALAREYEVAVVPEYSIALVEWKIL